MAVLTAEEAALRKRVSTPETVWIDGDPHDDDGNGGCATCRVWDWRAFQTCPLDHSYAAAGDHECDSIYLIVPWPCPAVRLERLTNPKW